MKALSLLALLPLSTLAASLPTNTIYSYQCEATFLEGEGVGPYNVDCPAYQRLGVLTAKYTHYLFSNEDSDNFYRKGSDEFYLPSICGRQLKKVSCAESKPREAFQLSRYREGNFVVAVSLSPSRAAGAEVYGFAAPQNPDGSCAKGLEARWAYRARPNSEYGGLPNSFQNTNGNLDNWELRGKNAESPVFELLRQRNKVPCDGLGNCADAVWGDERISQAVPYQRVQTGICVIPASR